MNILPTKGRVLVKKIERKEVETDNGILLSGQTLQEESLLFGEIVDGGQSEYKKGDKIFYSRYSATKVADDKGNAFYLVSDLDVMAVAHDTITV